MRTKVRKWLHGLAGGTIGGGATSASSWLGMAGAKAAGLDVPSLNLKSLGIIFASGAIASALLYLKQSPIPPDDDGEIDSNDLRLALSQKAQLDAQSRADLKKD